MTSGFLNALCVALSKIYLFNYVFVKSTLVRFSVMMVDISLNFKIYAVKKKLIRHELG
jgi:hypothetical protein